MPSYQRLRLEDDRGLLGWTAPTASMCQNEVSPAAALADRRSHRHGAAGHIVESQDGNGRLSTDYRRRAWRNRNTRTAYLHAVGRFFARCDRHKVVSLDDIEPLHVAAYIEALDKDFEKPTVKQHLAAIRMLFGWLVTGQIVASNSAHSVRGPKHVVKTGKTTVLDAEQARYLLDSIDTSSVVGLRDRALISVMTFAFARIGAVVAMRVEDYYPRANVGGSGCTRKVANAMRCRRITTWKPTWTHISRRPVSAMLGKLPSSVPPSAERAC
jgi:site-specific recombinase XerC